VKTLTLKNFLNNQQETVNHLERYCDLVSDVKWSDDRGNLRMKTFECGVNTFKITYLNGEVQELSMND
jgi:hypothetical protein